jgi:hypothetical protein
MSRAFIQTAYQMISASVYWGYLNFLVYNQNIVKKKFLPPLVFIPVISFLVL